MASIHRPQGYEPRALPLRQVAKGTAFLIGIISNHFSLSRCKTDFKCNNKNFT
jgi:hypothetical protein